MKKVQLDTHWPDSFIQSFYYDKMEIYGDVKSKYLGYYYQYENRRNATLDLIQKYLHKGGTILDVAAAQGNFSLTLAELGYVVTWNDLREELIDYVKLKYEKGKVEFAPGNVFDLGFNEQFDCVLITEIIEHVAHPDDFLIKISKMVKPGGFVVMTTPNGEYFLNKLPKFSDCPNPEIFESVQFKPNADGHIFLLYEDELIKLAEPAQLKMLDKRFFSNFLSHGHLKTSYILPMIPKALVNALEKFSQNLPGTFSKKLLAGMAVAYQKNK